MAKKKKSKRNSRAGWLLALGLITAAAFAINGMKASWSREPGAAPISSSRPDESNTSVTSEAFAATVPNEAPAPVQRPAGMVWIPGGEFSMGSPLESESLCSMPGMSRDASPVHRVYVDGFWMDATELTNAEYARFVKATGYVTIAERTPTAAEFPGAPPENLVAGSTVFTPTTEPIPLDNHYRWWRYQKGANWRQPEGPGSSINGREKYPVVQIAYDDAVAYAKWQTPADRSGVGVRSAWRTERKALRLGRRFSS
jgi:formylglycine-generating enzyme